MKKIMFDAHMHAFNLSHPNFGAMFKRISREKKMKIAITIYLVIHFILIIALSLLSLKYTLICLGGILILNIIFFKMLIKIDKFKNFLNLMDNTIGNYFLHIENDISKLDEFKATEKSENSYNKMALCPLMMEFTVDESGNNKSKAHYPLAKKSIQEQTIDLFYGIKDYYNDTNRNLLMFYPFMGITLNSKTYLKKGGLIKILNKYFDDSPIEKREVALNKDYQDFNGNIDDLKNFTFAGIKVYPPLGFNPWPVENENDLNRAKEFYELCIEKNIPIITHCGGDGFMTIPKAIYYDYGSPEKWYEVLKKYPTLRICFAHFGTHDRINDKFHWTSEIVKLILDDTYPNIFTDISCKCYNNKDFNKLDKLIRKITNNDDLKVKKIYEKMLYGTDFPMNIMKSESYSNYLNEFFKCDLNISLKRDLCEINPRKFLFNTL